MKLVVIAMLAALLCGVPCAFAGAAFGVEDSFSHAASVPASIAKDIEKTSEAGCFAESKTTVGDALEATNVDLGIRGKTLLLKPKLPGEDKAAYGCFCGAYSCPMWIYSVDGYRTRLLWSSDGASVEMIDHTDHGAKRLLVTSGSAGHQEAALYGWNGRQYSVLREKRIVLGQGPQADQNAQTVMDAFLKAAAH